LTFKKQPVLPDGLFTEFVRPRRQIIFGAFSDGGFISLIHIGLFGSILWSAAPSRF
jgi:hypothetical protein